MMDRATPVFARGANPESQCPAFPGEHEINRFRGIQAPYRRRFELREKSGLSRSRLPVGLCLMLPGVLFFLVGFAFNPSKAANTSGSQLAERSKKDDPY